MPRTYEDAFFLRDNPFCPVKLLEGLSSPLLMSNLSTQPLQIHKDDKLMDLYCEGIGEECLRAFKDAVCEAGYDPPAIGAQSFLSLILGPQGTGKTTLGNVMVHHLKQCKPYPPGEWKVYDQWADKEFDKSESQAAEIAQLGDRVLNETTDNDYCCVLLDNLRAGAEQEAFNLYGRLYQSRIVFFILLSSDPSLLKKNWENVKFGPAIYLTSALQPPMAVKYIEHRVQTFRCKQRLPPPTPDLFPFDSEDIKESLATKFSGPSGEVLGIVTLRQLNITLCRALRDSRRAPDPLQLPISLVKSYQKMVV